MVYKMNKIVVGKTLKSKLQNLDSRLELCDEGGKTLGFFVPAAEREGLLCVWARGEFSDEELQCARDQVGGLPLADALVDLGDE